MRHPALILILILGVAACEAPLPEDLVCPTLSVAASEGVEVSQGRVMTSEEEQVFGMGAMFESRVLPRQAASPAKVKVALISSGGQRGAFTAGFRVGWSQNQTDPRPAEFDIVTGALLAPVVFGGPAYDDRLTQAYDGLSERDVLRRRGTLALLGAPSLWDSAPLARQIEGQLRDTGLIDAIADASDDRTLLVGAVNLRSGGADA